MCHRVSRGDQPAERRPQQQEWTVFIESGEKAVDIGYDVLGRLGAIDGLAPAGVAAFVGTHPKPGPERVLDAGRGRDTALRSIA